MNSKGNRVLIPIVSRATLENIKNNIRDVEIFDEPLIEIKPDYKGLQRSLDEIVSYLDKEDELALIFTSKNAVEILVRYLRDNGILDKFIRMFHKVICIGPYTLDTLIALLKDYSSSLCGGCYLVPKIHNSTGVIRLIQWFDWRPILFCSRYVDRRLKETVLQRGGIVVELYDLIIDVEAMDKMVSQISEYQAAYIVFMSLQSLKAIRYLQPLRDKVELYGIFLSRRIYENADSTVFKGVSVFDGREVDKFYRFIENVVNYK